LSVAARPIADFAQYQDRLNGFVFRSGQLMRPIFAQAKTAPQRIIYAEGEDERILRAVEEVVEEGLARPILVGRPAVIAGRLDVLGLSVKPDRDFTIFNPEGDPRYGGFVRAYIEAAGRRGITPNAAQTIVRTDATVIAALAVRLGEADAMLCGVEGRYMAHLKNIRDVIGLCGDAKEFAALALVITAKGTFFLADTQVTPDPTAEELAEMAVLAAAHVRRFGQEPRIALVSHSNFGSYDTDSARKVQAATELLARHHPDLQVDGEMNGEAALNPIYRERTLPHSRLSGVANLLIMPNLDAANIAYQIIKALADALPVGPILVGAARPAHILTPSVTARGVVNMTAVAVAEAQAAGVC
jgi:malate dehydrogenase (oxaloacetate-decarboxylating)(NADP+)